MSKPIDSTSWDWQAYIKFYTEQWGATILPITKQKAVPFAWKQFQTQKPTGEQLSQWFANAWGIAIICGEASNNLLRLDIDTEELFIELKEAGAFPTNACIHKSAKGYGVFLRSKDVPFSVAEYSIPNFFQFGISGNNKLGNCPPTPGRTWERLYEDVATIDLPQWLDKYLGYSKGAKPGEEQLLIKCPFHEDTTPSLSISLSKGVYHCFGCNAEGKLSALLQQYRVSKQPIPTELKTSLSTGLTALPSATLSNVLEIEPPKAIIEGLLEEGENAKAIISGVSGIGKTTLGLSIALPLSKGMPVLGRLPVPKARCVGYVNFEQRGSSVMQQANRMEEFLLDGKPSETLHFIDGMNLHLVDDYRERKLYNTVLREGIEVLILDSILATAYNYNDIDEVRLIRQYLAEFVEELHCGILILHHTASGLGGGVGAERAKGTLGKDLNTWAATKLLYNSFEPKRKYVGRLSGESRGWGAVDYPIVYEDFTHSAWIADWDKIGMSDEEQHGLGRPVVIDQLEQAILLARNLGYSMEKIAEEIGVSRRTLYYWMSGDQFPDQESKDKLEHWILHTFTSEQCTKARLGT